MRASLFIVGILLSPACLAHDTAKVPEPMDQDSLLKAFNWDLASAKVSSQKITTGLHVLFGLGGNIAASIGEDGVLIVDDQFPELIPQVKATIKALGGENIDFAINTHWHFDHAKGNLTLGPSGTWLVSQANSRKMMQQDNIINLVVAAHKQKAYPAKALPVISFDQHMQFHFNGEQIDLLHFGPAHTTGDAAIYFRGSNAIHMGDVFNTSGYPFIDAGNGGSIDGVIAFCKQVLAIINKDTVVIPGHGPVADYATLQAYVQMLVTVRGRIAKLLKGGASLEQVVAANVTSEFDGRYGDNRMLVDRAYTSLAHAHD